MAAQLSQPLLPEREHAFAAVSPETTQTYLRRVTRPWHARVEAAYEGFDLRSREGLCGFLSWHAIALLPLEQQVSDCGAADMLPDWTERRRSHALMADLIDLGLSPPTCGSAPPLPSRTHGLGALYVLEGSKLGGRVLLKRVLGSSDSRVRSATRFLGHAHPGGWTKFVAILNGLSQTPQTRAKLQAGAMVAFAKFLPIQDGSTGAALPGHLPSDLVHNKQA